jgi:hypothetical protein
MTPAREPTGSPASPVLVEDLFLTETFLIKGRLARKGQRLTKMLEDHERLFLTIEDAVMIALRGGEEIRTARVLVNTSEVILAHEFVDFAGDAVQRSLATNEKPVRIRAFYNGGVQLELSGMIAPAAYEPAHPGGRRFFIMRDPVLRGLNLDEHRDLAQLRQMSYAIVAKHRLAYIYEFGG